MTSVCQNLLGIQRGIFRYSSVSDSARTFPELVLNFPIQNAQLLEKLHLEYSSILDLF